MQPNEFPETIRSAWTDEEFCMRSQLANVHDRKSVESIYPEQIWEQDAATNSVPTTGVHRGLLIRTACDTDGWFELDRAARSVGEDTHDQDAMFLCPFMGKAADLFVEVPGVHGAYALRPGADFDFVEDYRRFIDRVIDAAKCFGRSS
jgi:hypothetical protein